MPISSLSQSYSNFLFEDSMQNGAGAAAAEVESDPLFSEDIEDYLAPFEEVGRFNIEAAEEATIFLLGEGHGDPRGHRMQADLIQFLASQGPVIVLVESLESGKFLVDEIRQESVTLDGINYFGAWDAKVPFNLENSGAQNILVMGWDGSKGIIRSSGYNPGTVDLLETIISKIEGGAASFFDQIRCKSPECAEVLLDVMGVLPPEEMLYKTADKPNAIKVEVFDKITALVSSQKIGSMDSIPFLAIRELLALGSTMAKYEIEAQEGEKHLATEASISKTFPVRTASMVSSLRQLAGIQLDMGDENVKVVFIAGASHLKTAAYEYKNPDKDLSSLYAELQLGGHKATILIPPHVLAFQDELSRECLASRAGQDEEKE